MSENIAARTAVATESDDPPVLTPEQEARFAAYLAEPRELPKSGIDPKTGRALPISEEELRERWERLERELAKIDAEDDDPPMSLEEFKSQMNDERRREGARLLYREP